MRDAEPEPNGYRWCEGSGHVWRKCQPDDLREINMFPPHCHTLCYFQSSLPEACKRFIRGIPLRSTVARMLSLYTWQCPPCRASLSVETIFYDGSKGEMSPLHTVLCRLAVLPAHLRRGIVMLL